MTEQHREPQDEISDLRQSLESFEQEKERVRAIIGKIGGVPSFHTKLINGVFIAVILTAGVVSIVSKDLRLLMVELTTVMLSVKIIYLMHTQMRVNHFKFWILSAIEWRISEMMVEIKQVKKELAQKKEA